jgi:hypothetical protein
MASHQEEKVDRLENTGFHKEICKSQDHAVLVLPGAVVENKVAENEQCSFFASGI